MSGQQYQIRGDTRANVEAATPALRELGVVTDKNELVIGDGATAGGLPLQRKNRSESLAPAQITADQNNYSPASYDRHCGVLVLNTDAKRRITGIAGGSTDRTLIVLNGGTQQIVLSDADAGSTAANRFDLNGDLTLLPKGSIKLFYNATASRWQRTSGGNKLATIPEELLLAGVISPAQITADQNDYAPTSVTLAVRLRLNTDASRNITGLADARDGAIKHIINVGANNIVLKNENAGSSAANRFSFGADITLAAKQGALIEYDTTDSRWKLIAQTAGAAVSAGAVIASTLAGSALGALGMVNGTLVESHAGSAVTYAVKTLAGADPSAGDPTLFVFQTSSGAYVVRTVTAALSIVVSSGSALGATNGVPFRIWIVAFDDAGTVRLGVKNCSDANNIYSLDEATAASSTAEGGAGAADNIGTFYTGTAVASKYYVILGFATYEAGLAAAGTWGVSPTVVQLFGPGVPRPGAVLQETQVNTSTAVTNTTSTFAATNLTKAIVLSSAANLVRAQHSGAAEASAACVGQSSLHRAGAPVGPQAWWFSVGGQLIIPHGGGPFLDKPGSTASQTYDVRIKVAAAAGTVSLPSNTEGGQATMNLQELMG